MKQGRKRSPAFCRLSRVDPFSLSANRLLTLNNQKGAALLAGYAYTYNTVNDRLTRTETVNGISTTQGYGYDAIDQITIVNYGTGRTQGFDYDFVGNRKQATDSATSGPETYTSNNLNQYTLVSSQPAALNYDVNGNLKKVGNWTYGHDSLNRFVSAASTGSSPVAETLSYDARNRCVKRVINGTATFYVYDNWSLVAEYSATGTATQKYLNGGRIDEILGKTAPAQAPVYYLQDGLSSTVGLTDSAGNLVERYTYDVYGKPAFYNGFSVSQAGTNYGNRFLFTGREYLAELNLYDYRNRKYSAELGRWLERDPLKSAERKQGPNLYEYVENDPVNLNDPTGLISPGTGNGPTPPHKNPGDGPKPTGSGWHETICSPFFYGQCIGFCAKKCKFGDATCYIKFDIEGDFLIIQTHDTCECH